MKINKHFTLDLELVERLSSEDNASSLINELLKEYYEVRSKKNTLLDQKQAVLDQIKVKKKAISKDIKILSEWKSLNLDNFSKFWIKSRKEKPSILDVKTYIKNRSLSLSSQCFLKAWDLINKYGELLK